MSLIAHYLDADNQIHSNIDLEAVLTARKSRSGLLWLDLTGAGDDERELLLDEFKFHPLVVDGAISTDVRPARVEDFGDYIFVNARSVDYAAETEVVQTTDLGMFIGQNFVVTIHNEEMPSVEAVKQLVEIDGRPMMKGSGFFAHALFDSLIQAILPTLDRMEDHADAIEEQVLVNPDNSALIALMAIKRSCLSLNRALIPQREVLSRLGRREFDLLGSGVDIYFRDLLDDLLLIQTANDVIRERADTSLATYLSVVSNRQNEIMKVLSIVATIFLPLGLIAGLFGMNFVNMPGLDFRWGYHIVVAASLIALALVIWMFWLKRWVIAGAGLFRPRHLTRFVPSAVDPVQLTGFLTQTTVRTLRRAESDIASTARRVPSIFQRINPVNLRRESQRRRPPADR